MSSAFLKFYSFVGDLGLAKINLNTDTLMILLTNTSPNSGDTIVNTTTSTCTVGSVSNALEIVARNGYSKGGSQLVSNSYSQTGGVGSLISNAVTFTASGGTIGPFEWAVLYSATSGTSATRSLIGYFDYGSAITLNSLETFTIGNSNNGGNWTLTYPILTLT